MSFKWILTKNWNVNVSSLFVKFSKQYAPRKDFEMMSQMGHNGPNISHYPYL